MKRLILAFSLLAGVTAHAERESYRPRVLAPSTTAGTILFDDGTAAAPSISFGADTNTGIYRRGADQPSIALNGTERISFAEVSGTGVRMCLGIGCSSASAASTFGAIQGTDAIGTDVLGANIAIDSGRGTGNRSGGAILFRTSPAGASGSTQNVVVLRMQIDGQEVILGNGQAAASPSTSTLRGTNGTGTNIAAANLTIQPGRGTGTGAGGDLVLNTAPAGASGTTLNAAVERARINSAGVLLMASGSKIDAGGSTFELPNGAALPATCVVGELFQDTDSNDCANTGGGDGALCICKTTNTWALISNF